jgi:chromosome segregation ATPase
MTYAELLTAIRERKGLGLKEYQAELGAAGLTSQLRSILTIKQGDTKTLCKKTPRQLFEYVISAKGNIEVIGRYNDAHRKYKEAQQNINEANNELRRQKDQLRTLQGDLEEYEEYEAKKAQQKTLAQELIKAEYKEAQSRGLTASGSLGSAAKEAESLKGVISRLKEDERLAEARVKAIGQELGQLGPLVLGLTRQLGAVKQQRKDFSTREKTLRALPKEDISLADQDAEQLLLQAGAHSQDAEQWTANVGTLRDEATTLDKRAAALLAGARETDLPPEIAATLEQPYPIAAGLEPAEAWRGAVEAVLREHRQGFLAPVLKPADLARYARRAPGRPLHIDQAEPPAEQLGLLAHVRVTAPVPQEVLALLANIQPLEGDEPPGDGRIGVTKDGVLMGSTWALAPEIQPFLLGSAGLRSQADALQAKAKSLREETNEVERKAALALAEATKLRGLAGKVGDAKQWKSAQEELTRISALEEAATKEEKRLQAELDSIEPKWLALGKERAAVEQSLSAAKTALGSKETRLAGIEGERPGWQAQLDEARGTCERILARQDVEPSWFQPTSLEDVRGVKEVDEEQRAVQKKVQRMETSEVYCKDPDIPLKYRTKENEVAALQANLQDLQKTVERAVEELKRVQEQYNQVVLQVVGEYHHRVEEIARAGGIEVRVRTENIRAESLDNAELYVEVGFDGKSPAPMNSGHLSGGQKTVTSIILLLGLTDPGDEQGFFIIDEPYADLDFENVVRVNEFLRATGAQYVITVPTKSHVEFYEGADLQLALQTARGDDDFADTPTLMVRRQ